MYVEGSRAEIIKLIKYQGYGEAHLFIELIIKIYNYTYLCCTLLWKWTVFSAIFFSCSGVF